IDTSLADVGRDGTWTEVRTAIESSEITAAIKEAASEVATAVRSTIADAGLEGTFARARAAIDRADVSPLNALFAQAAVGARRVASVRPHLQLPAPRVSGPARVRAPRVWRGVRVAGAVSQGATERLRRMGHRAAQHRLRRLVPRDRRRAGVARAGGWDERGRAVDRLRRAGAGGLVRRPLPRAERARRAQGLTLASDRW